jgi:hypothetical protein
MNQPGENPSQNDLRQSTNQMIDDLVGLIAECMDADVAFVPTDPEANDKFAINPAEVNLSWTLGHVIVHTTASAEEAAFVAAELARGVPHRGGRSRYEVPWQDVTTIAQCRARLEESRRMRLASLGVWPDPPHLENTYTLERYPEPINAVMRFVMGLQHDDSHLEQIKKIVAQAMAARN